MSVVFVFDMSVDFFVDFFIWDVGAGVCGCVYLVVVVVVCACVDFSFGVWQALSKTTANQINI